MRTIGADSGGTFTDLVEIDERGKISFEKAFSTPQATHHGVLDALEALARTHRISVSDVLESTGRFAHGTTVSTNAVIQRTGSRVGLLITHGFEDTLTIARGPLGRTGGLPLAQARDFLHTEVPAPLVPKQLTVGLRERVSVTGEVLCALRETEVRAALTTLMERGAESIAVCLLWAFRNPAHEALVGRIAAELAPHLPVSLSSQVAPRIGEFERCVTTVINAYVGPITTGYIQALQARLAEDGFAGRLQVMKSSGGVTFPERVPAEAVSIINSGPIGGLVAARHIGRLLGYDNILTADMGGTSFDVGIIAGGAFEETGNPFVDQGLPLQIPAIDVVTIGAGGGSIAWTDGYRLQVGPLSAGADPGPVCYGRGGQEPTVTDALVTLGIIDPDHFFGGRHRLDKRAAEHAIETRIAKPLGLTTVAAAAGIYEVITQRMADLIRKATVESGNDPKDFCLLAYGGAAGAHCAHFAAALGIAKVVIPHAAAAFSALGCALADIQFSHSRSEPVPLTDVGIAASTINDTVAAVKQVVIDDIVAADIAVGEVVFALMLELRYVGQMNEVTVAWDGLQLGDGDIARLRRAFEAHYVDRFGAGTTHAGSEIELISVRVEAVKTVPKPDFATLAERPERAVGNETKAHRPVYQHGAGWLDAAVLAFDGLVAGHAVQGPAVIEHQTTTVWLPPRTSATLDVYGNLAIVPDR